MGMGSKITRRSLVMAGLTTLVLYRPADAAPWIVDEIYAAAARHGVSGDWLLSTATCESNLDPGAVNPRTGDSGLFQFNHHTWAEFAGYRGIAVPDIWSVWWQADMAAWAFSAGYHTRWCCSGTFPNPEICQ
jgi:soluble lytic murein transglycosylase-like protein